MRRTALLLLCSLLPGCFVSRAETDRPLDASAFGELVVGTSTSNDAVRLLGAPQDVVELGHGSAWHYRFSKTKRAGLFLIVVGLLNDDTQSDRVWLFFDADGRLTEAAGSFDAAAAEWELP
ncbi:MAG: hypothetical protein R3F34_01170 [Planctomycetota bacterium]